MLILNPARKIIELCGGADVVSRMTRRNLYRIHRWTWPKEKGGNDGIIPFEAMHLILSEAQKRSIKEVSADLLFVEGARALPREDLRVLALLMDGEPPEGIAKTLTAPVEDVLSTEMRLRKCPEIAESVWVRVARRRDPKYRSRRARK